MVHGGANDRESEREIYGGPETGKLDHGQALVVIHGEYDVGRAGSRRESGIGWQRADNVHPGVAALVDDGFDDGADEHRFQYAEGTAPAICEAEIRSIECSHCKLRLGITDKRAVNARCALCGKVTNIAEAREKQKLVPAKLPRADVVAQCRACKAYVGVPKKVATFQCASCGQVNVAGAIRA